MQYADGFVQPHCECQCGGRCCTSGAVSKAIYPLVLRSAVTTMSTLVAAPRGFFEVMQTVIWKVVVALNQSSNPEARVIPIGPGTATLQAFNRILVALQVLSTSCDPECLSCAVCMSWAFGVWHPFKYVAEDIKAYYSKSPDPDSSKGSDPDSSKAQIPTHPSRSDSDGDGVGDNDDGCLMTR